MSKDCTEYCSPIISYFPFDSWYTCVDVMDTCEILAADVASPFYCLYREQEEMMKSMQ